MTKNIVEGIMLISDFFCSSNSVKRKGKAGLQKWEP